MPCRDGQAQEVLVAAIDTMHVDGTKEEPQALMPCDLAGNGNKKLQATACDLICSC